MKRCSKCKQDLPFSDFHERGVNQLGEKAYQSQCKECHKETSRAGYKKPRFLRRDEFTLAGFVCY